MTLPCAAELATGRDPFFSDDPAERARAHRICSGCPAAVGCEEGARRRHEPFGIWNGYEGDQGLDGEPMLLGFPRPSVKSAKHGSRSRYLTCTDGEDGGKCDACRSANAEYQAGYRNHGPAVTRPESIDPCEQLMIGEAS